LPPIGVGRYLPRLLIHRAPALFHQKLHQAGFHRVRLQLAQTFAMTHQQVQQRGRLRDAA
jgi:hypothetical protein